LFRNVKVVIFLIIIFLLAIAQHLAIKKSLLVETPPPNYTLLAKIATSSLQLGQKASECFLKMNDQYDQVDNSLGLWLQLTIEHLSPSKVFKLMGFDAFQKEYSSYSYSSQVGLAIGIMNEAIKCLETKIHSDDTSFELTECKRLKQK
jgi:hypothetical protein